MSKKLFEDLLATLKRSNKARKLVLAERAGYSTVEEYKEYLEKQINGMTSESKVQVKKESKKVKENLTDMVIAFDTTGSMMSYIQAVKKHVTELIPTLFAQNPGLNISIVAFGDYCDMENPHPMKMNFGKAYQVIGLTNSQKDLISFVNYAQNTSGGDGDEFYELVIKKITEETQWREGSNKSVLFIGDDNPHKPGYTYGGHRYDIDWKQEALNAKKKDIIFDTLRIHESREWYQELANITGGICLPFRNSSKTAKVVEATALARGGESTRSAFMAKSVSAEVTTDGDMSAVYGMYSKEVVNKK